MGSALPRRVLVFPMSGRGMLAQQSWSASLRRMWVPSYGDRRNNLRKDTDAPNRMVSGGLVDYQPEERGQCPWVAAGAGIG